MCDDRIPLIFTFHSRSNNFTAYNYLCLLSITSCLYLLTLGLFRSRFGFSSVISVELPRRFENLRIEVINIMMIGYFRIIVLVVLIVSAGSSTLSIRSKLPIEGELEIPTGESASNIEVTLNGGEYRAYSRIDGKFTFHDIPSGIYLLDVLSIHQVFSQMKIKIVAEEEIISVVEFKYPGAMRMQGSKTEIE